MSRQPRQLALDEYEEPTESRLSEIPVLRDYQDKCVRNNIAAYNRGVRATLNTSPTGTGKSVPIAELARRASRNRKKVVLALAQREVLVRQLFEHIDRYIPDRVVGIDMGADKVDSGTDIVIGSVQSLGRKGTRRLAQLEDNPPSLIIVDECHHSGGDTYMNVADRYGRWDDRSLWCGFSATTKPINKIIGPYGKPLWQEEVFHYELLDAIRDGWLVPIRGKRVSTSVDLSGVHQTAGDWSQEELAIVLDTDARNKLGAESWQANAEGRKTLVHCVDIDHAYHACEAFREADIKCDWVAGTPHKLASGDMSKGMSIETRQERIKKWKTTDETEVMCHCDVLMEGFDFPEISCVMWLRATQSWIVYMQGIGRGTRLAPCIGKTDLLVIDLVDNCKNHSPISLPCVVGLDYQFDMGDKDLVEVEEAVKKAKAEGKNVLKAKDLEGLQRLETEIDIFGDSQLPPEVQAHSSLSWMKCEGGYLIPAPLFPPYNEPWKRNSMPKRVARITLDSAGAWMLSRYVNGRNAGTDFCGYDNVPDFKYADKIVSEQFPESLSNMKQNRKGVGAPLTPFVKGRLTSLQVPKSEQARVDLATAKRLVNMGEATGWRYGKPVV